VDDLPVLSASPFSVGASPILVPVAPQSGTPKWLMPALIGLGALLIIVAGTLIYLLTRSSKKTEVAANDKGGISDKSGVNPPGTGLPPAGTGDKGTAPVATGDKGATPAGNGTAPVAAGGDKPAPGGDTPPAGDKPAAGGDKPAAGGHDKGHGGHDKPDKSAKPDKPGKPDKPDKPAVEDKPVKTPGGDKPMSKGDIEIKCMVNPDLPICKKGGGGDKGGGDKPKPVEKDLPEQLGKPDIQAGIGAIKGSATGCYEKYKVPGTVMIHLTISPGGGVSGASATGSFSGTPTGSCVEGAVKHAHFKKFSGPAMSVNYPFVLR
jgi:hypothetical protein